MQWQNLEFIVLSESDDSEIMSFIYSVKFSPHQTFPISLHSLLYLEYQYNVCLSFSCSHVQHLSYFPSL